MESYNKAELKNVGIRTDFVQDNQSFSKHGTLRGLHFQNGKHAQTKLIRVVSGHILDVVFDMRRRSKTFGKSYSVDLTSENNLQLLIPKGFAHGFVVLSKGATISYKSDEFYAPDFEHGIHYADPSLSIDWRLSADQIFFSDKDDKLPTFDQIDHEFY